MSCPQHLLVVPIAVELRRTSAWGVASRRPAQMFALRQLAQVPPEPASRLGGLMNLRFPEEGINSFRDGLYPFRGQVYTGAILREGLGISLGIGVEGSHPA